MSPGLIDLLGVGGSLLVVAAYWGVASGRLNARRAPYHALNALGAALLLVSLAVTPNFGAIVMEAAWLAIALWSLARRRV